VYHLKKNSRGKICRKTTESSPNGVHSDQMVLETVSVEAGLLRGGGQETIKTKLDQGGPTGSSPLRSGGSHDGQQEAGPP
jgi:hypothetical protein